MNDQQQILPVSLLEGIKDIIVGGFHSIAIASKGIWVWGKSDMCNLGFPSQFSAIQVPKFVQIDISQACAGNQHSFVWKNNEVYCWGSNKEYKLGFQNPIQYSLTKSLIFQEAIGAGMQLNQISCGDSHSLAFFKLLEQTGISYQIFAWGQSKSYQLALQTQGTVTQPILIDFNQSVRKLYSRNDYNFLITQQGDCYSWGTNLFGRLGFQKSINNQKLPTQVKSLTKIRSISMGKYHCIAINEKHEVFCWGHGVQGQLGLNKIVSETTPTKIEFQQKVIQSACGEYHSVILTDKLQLYACGSNSYFALGHQEVDEKKRCKKFVKIKINQNIKISKIVSGNRHNLLLTFDGKVYSWGCNKFGQLGRMPLQNKPINIKKELYKQQNFINDVIKKTPESLNQNKESVNPFQQIRYSPSPYIQKQQGKSLQQRISEWRQKYQKFKYQKEKEQKQLLNQLQYILKQYR